MQQISPNVFVSLVLLGIAGCSEESQFADIDNPMKDSIGIGEFYKVNTAGA